MQITLSRSMLETIDAVVAHAARKCEILEIYKASTAIQKMHLSDKVALEDIMNEILIRARPNTAFSFQPL